MDRVSHGIPLSLSPQMWQLLMPNASVVCCVVVVSCCAVVGGTVVVSLGCVVVSGAIP